MVIFKWIFADEVLLFSHFSCKLLFVGDGGLLQEYSCRNLLMVEHHCRRASGFILMGSIGEQNSGLA